MLRDGKIWMGKGETDCYLLLNQANRHGLIAGASGTGKTVTLKTMAESFSQAGVPVFLADAKGDVRGMCQPGVDSEKMQARLEAFGVKDIWEFKGCPCRFWNILDGDGMPVRVTVSQMGPLLLSRMMELSEVQEAVLNLVFRVADDNQLLLIDLKDLRAMLNYVSEHAKEYENTYGHVSSASVGAILRGLIALENQGGTAFFGEPELDLMDWFACAPSGEGYVNILDARGLISQPLIYSMFLLWMLSELFEKLPEVGDLDQPKFVFFFDEAHLLFNGMPGELLDKIVQVVKLVRSKGVGVYFITQSPSDIPDQVLAQLSNRVQHGLRAYTPAEQKAVRTAAQTFRANPNFKTEDAIMDLGTGEALVSFLDEGGRPSVVDRVKISASQCLMAAPEESYVQAVRDAQLPLMSKYGTAVDNESAYEVLQEQAEKKAEEDALAAERAAFEKEKEEWAKQKAAEEEKARKQAEKEAEAAQKKAEREAEAAKKKAEREAEAKKKADQKKAEAASRELTKTIGSVGRTAANQLIRGLFKGLK